MVIIIIVVFSIIVVIIIIIIIMTIDTKVEEMIGSLVSRLEPSTDCIVWRCDEEDDDNDDADDLYIIGAVCLSV